MKKALIKVLTILILTGASPATALALTPSQYIEKYGGRDAILQGLTERAFQNFKIITENLTDDELYEMASEHAMSMYNQMEIGLSAGSQILSITDAPPNSFELAFEIHDPRRAISGSLITVTFGSTKYYLDNAEFSEPTLVYNDVAYLPAAYLARMLGFTTVWDAETNTTELTSTGVIPPPPTAIGTVSPAMVVETKTIYAVFGATSYFLDGVRFSDPTLVYNDVAYLPAAYLARKLNLIAVWDAETNTTTLSRKED